VINKEIKVTERIVFPFFSLIKIEVNDCRFIHRTDTIGNDESNLLGNAGPASRASFSSGNSAAREREREARVSENVGIEITSVS